MLSIVIILTAFGIIMIAMEVILPGGILGVAGALAICAALVLTATSPGLDSIGPGGRFLLGTGVVVTTAVLLVLWLRFFTQTRFIRKHLLKGEVGGTSTYDKYQLLLDQTGTAETDLRPSGKALLGGKKHDVLAETGMIERGTSIRVVKVEGSRVIVRPST